MMLNIFFLILLLCQFTEIYASKILNADECSEKIGNGGNYISKNNGRLSGKCEGNAIAPELEEDAIIFSVLSENLSADKSINTKELINKSVSINSIKKVNDRVELTFLKPDIIFGKTYEFNFKLKVFSDSDVTNYSFYLLQIWQAPQYSPIFGLRMKRGTNDRATFMIRNFKYSVAGENLLNIKLSQEWKKIKIYFQINADMQGKINIFENNKKVLSWAGAIGYKSYNNIKPNFRLKFGIYKHQEPSKTFKIAYKDILFKEINDYE